MHLFSTSIPEKETHSSALAGSLVTELNSKMTTVFPHSAARRTENAIGRISPPALVLDSPSIPRCVSMNLSDERV